METQNLKVKSINNRGGKDIRVDFRPSNARSEYNFQSLDSIRFSNNNNNKCF